MFAVAGIDSTPLKSTPAPGLPCLFLSLSSLCIAETLFMLPRREERDGANSSDG
jgi:hypothetical protein